MKKSLAIVGILALAAMSEPAAAQGLVYGGYTSQGNYRYGAPVQALPTPFSNGGSCVAWCRADVTPCDPDYYKVSDRRCNYNQNGYFGN